MSSSFGNNSPYRPIEKALLFLKWAKDARTLHSIDSPYISSLYRHIFTNDKIQHQAEIEELRRFFKRDLTSIPTSSLGQPSFSRVSKKEATVAHIEKTAVSSRRKCKLLFQLARYFGSNKILELGMSLGISTLYFCSAVDPENVCSIEGNRLITDYVKPLLPEWSKGLTILNDSFENALAILRKQNQSFDFIFIDGGHDGPSLFTHLELLSPLLSDVHVLVIDDIYWSKEMTTVWNQIQQSKKYNLGLDFWHFGLLTSRMEFKEPISVKLQPIHLEWRPGIFR